MYVLNVLKGDQNIQLLYLPSISSIDILILFSLQVDRCLVRATIRFGNLWSLATTKRQEAGFPEEATEAAGRKRHFQEIR